ncbi:unnamed protein product [Effrenium voratum]|nr:unnamed protein product [Effrenium voratum]
MVPVYEIVEGGEDWRKQLPERPVTPNMMRWQRFYEAPCGFACCFSPDCACLRCSGCGKSLTSLPPKARFQCMDCEILPPETPFDPRPELCVACFGSDQALHWHSRFLLVDERGAHRAVERKLGLAEPKLVTTLRSDGFEGCNFERFLAGSQQMVEELARP